MFDWSPVFLVTLAAMTVRGQRWDDKAEKRKMPSILLVPAGFIIAYYTFLNLTELIFGSLHNNEFCITMSQNIGMKATEQRVSVAVFITKKVCYAPWS